MTTRAITKLTLLTIFILFMSLFLFACTSSSEPQLGSPVPEEEQTKLDQEQQENEEQANEEDKDAIEEEKAEEEAVEPEAEKVERFYVNPNNFMIYPLLEEGEIFEDKIVLLTFDDTPTGDATGAILDTLDKYDAKAIFFINGHYAIRNLDWLHEIHNRGHIIANHTWWHIFIRREGPDKVREEIIRVNDFVEEHFGERPVYFRPPFGQNSDVSRAIIKEEGMQSMNWSNGSLDWELKTPEAITEQVLKNIRSGDNILFHDKQITAEALEPILQALTEQGYRFVLPTEVILED